MKAVDRTLACAALIAGALAAPGALGAPAAAQPPPSTTGTPTPPQPSPSWLPGTSGVTLPEQAGGGPVLLTLERAIELALQQQPSVRQIRAQAEAAAGRADLSRVARHPTVTLAATASIGSSRVGPCSGDATMRCGGFFHPSEATGLSATAGWRLYDFGLTDANVRAAELNEEAARAAIKTSGLDVQTAVELAYFEAVARERLIKVAQATVASEEGHLDQARRFVAAGAKDPIEVAQAQARAANARSALSQAQSNQAIALANLRSSIGWVDPTSSPAVDPNWPTPPVDEPVALAGLVGAARKNRPEILQLDKQILASDASLTAARAEQRPVLSAQATTQWTPATGDWSPQPEWSAGLTLSFPILDGGKSSADARIAQANLSSTIAQRDALLVTLTSQLDSARAQIVADRANVTASMEAVTAARAALHLAEGRYAQGLGSQIELADAQTAVTTAEGNLISAQFQLADAWAQLRRALGQ